MNLFILDVQPVQAAHFNNDAHVRKIILEATEMMGYAYDDKTFQPWKWLRPQGRYYKHPMSVWVRESRRNFDWTLQHAYGLCQEFTYRFGKIHKCQGMLDWIGANLPIQNLPDEPQTDWPRCFGQYRETIEFTESAVFDYRQYYIVAKKHLAVWTKREIPYWFRFI